MKVDTHESWEALERTYGYEWFRGVEVGPEWAEVFLGTDQLWSENTSETQVFWASFRALPGGSYEVTGWRIEYWRE